MKIPAGNFVVEIESKEEQGANWIVRLYKKSFPFKRLISSDWFLQEQQATVFGQELAERVRNSAETENIRMRKPGWTLIRPA